MAPGRRRALAPSTWALLGAGRPLQLWPLNRPERSVSPPATGVAELKMVREGAGELGHPASHVGAVRSSAGDRGKSVSHVPTSELTCH